MSVAAISAIRIAAAHDGEAELVVTLRHGNGSTSDVILGHVAASELLRSCDTTNPDELLGVGFEKVRDAMLVSSNRYQ
ncbi:MAG: hypothetical protein FJ194_18060 [Gammaproteobacteria bacterium]|nr:hypothetical protein [Gammaproteobacteria bacterium]